MELTVTGLPAKRIDGTDMSDALKGSSVSSDRIDAKDDNDVVQGYASHNRLHEGDGDDRLNGGDGTRSVVERQRRRSAVSRCGQ
jgi:hypothetical protein